MNKGELERLKNNDLMEIYKSMYGSYPYTDYTRHQLIDCIISGESFVETRASRTKTLYMSKKCFKGAV